MRKLHLIELRTNPKCCICGKSMESAGKLQGYRCKKCRTYCKEKEVQVEKRDIENGLYEVPPVARRHISKPLIRILMKGKSKKIHPSR
jgi:tRNA(Ile2)-agmatinylcytidine synthase